MWAMFGLFSLIYGVIGALFEVTSSQYLVAAIVGWVLEGVSGLLGLIALLYL